MKNTSTKNIMKQINYYFSAVVGSCCYLCGLFLCSLLLLVDVKIDIEIIVEFIEFVNAQFLQNLINQMHEQSFCLLHCNIFLLQPQFQMLYEKSTSKAHCKNYSMRLHKNLTSNYSNPILDYLSIIETGARVGTGDDDGG